MLFNLPSLTLVLHVVIYSGGVTAQPGRDLSCSNIRVALERCDLPQAMKEIADMLSELGVVQTSAEDYSKVFRVLFNIATLVSEPREGVNLRVSLKNARFIFELLLNGTAEGALARIEKRTNGTFLCGDSRDVYCVGVNFQRIDAHRLVLSWAANVYSGNGTLSKSLPRRSEDVMYWRNRTQPETNRLIQEPSMLRREPIRDHYDILEKVGEGRNVVVYKCVEKKTGNVFAARFVKLWMHFQFELIYEEINIMNKLRHPGHPNLLTLHEVFENDAEIIMIVDFLQDLWVGFSIKDTPKIIRQICEGLQYMHARNIVHMDVRFRNIMRVPNARKIQVKLTDFGLAQEADKMKGFLRTDTHDGIHFHDYNTPEMLLNRSMGTYTDMWYLGVTTYYILTKDYPHWGDTCNEIDENITKGQWAFTVNYTSLSRKSLKFIGNLLVPDIKKRMTAEQCLSDPWILDG